MHSCVCPDDALKLTTISSTPALGHAAPHEVACVGNVRERVPDEREELDDDHDDDEDHAVDLHARMGWGVDCRVVA